jgi:hypothetical protein
MFTITLFDHKINKEFHNVISMKIQQIGYIQFTITMVHLGSEENDVIVSDIIDFKSLRILPEKNK